MAISFREKLQESYIRPFRSNILRIPNTRRNTIEDGCPLVSDAQYPPLCSSHPRNEMSPGAQAATPPPPPSKPMDRQKGDYPRLVTSAFLSSLPSLLLTSLNETNPAPAQHPPSAWRPHATQPIGGVNLSELFSHQLL